MSIKYKRKVPRNTIFEKKLKVQSGSSYFERSYGNKKEVETTSRREENEGRGVSGERGIGKE